MKTLDRNFIDGRWVQAEGETITTINPTTAQPLSTVRFASVTELDRAVEAAHAAFANWGATSTDDRRAVLQALRDGLTSRSEELAHTIAEEVGSPLWFSRRIGLPFPIRNVELAIEAMDELFAETRVGSSLVLREPYGVVAAITPWNAPVHQIVAKVAAALAAGCTVVLKPSEFAAGTARLFAEIAEQAGVPAGVFNMVFGGPSIGEALASHPLVDVVSFTGSMEVGSQVAAAAARGVKKVMLELGGKSATILLDDADLERAAETIPNLCFANSGQVCVSQSRLLVPRALLPEIERRLTDAIASWGIGPPTDEASRIGPVASQRQLDRVRGYIETGVREGGRLIAGGIEPVADREGFYVRPTIFSGVTPEMTIAREEIFGPVLAIIPFDTEDEAVEIANQLPLGLSGGVWSADINRAQAIARCMRTGQVAINGAPQNLATPFGGYKQSGYGRENGRYGVEEFLQYKVIHGAAQ